MIVALWVVFAIAMLGLVSLIFRAIEDEERWERQYERYQRWLDEQMRKLEEMTDDRQ